MAMTNETKNHLHQTRARITVVWFARRDARRSISCGSRQRRVFPALATTAAEGGHAVVAILSVAEGGEPERRRRARRARRLGARRDPRRRFQTRGPAPPSCGSSCRAGARRCARSGRRAASAACLWAVLRVGEPGDERAFGDDDEEDGTDPSGGRPERLRNHLRRRLRGTGRRACSRTGSATSTQRCRTRFSNGARFRNKSLGSLGGGTPASRGDAGACRPWRLRIESRAVPGSRQTALQPRAVLRGGAALFALPFSRRAGASRSARSSTPARPDVWMPPSSPACARACAEGAARTPRQA